MGVTLSLAVPGTAGTLRPAAKGQERRGQQQREEQSLGHPNTPSPPEAVEMLKVEELRTA